MDDRFCSGCSLALNRFNAVKNGIVNGKQRYNSICKACHCAKQMIHQKGKGHERRKEYARQYLRKTGKVKQYPCETCSVLCYKKYARAFCSDKCRFMAYVFVKNDCWLWSGATNRRNYGKLSFRTKKTEGAHRVSYQLFKGNIPDGGFVCHSCDNPQCVKPAHLWIGNARKNKDDQIEKDRIGIKLKRQDVLTIRQLVIEGKGSQSIANMFNVTCSTISNIKAGRTWAHL